MLQGDETMANKAWRICIPTLFCLFLFYSPHATAQQTLGGITGTVTDASGAVITGATVTLVGDQTKLTRTLQTTDTGRYDFVNLPIGTYTLTFTHEGFETQKIPSITVQADRTVTLRDRDSLRQERVAIDELAGELERRLRAPWRSPKLT